MNDSDAVIEISDLTKRYGDFCALDSLSLHVNKGQILGFIGPNGAGKTTTIRILVGLLKPTSGSARISGADCLQESRKIKRLVGYMPDEFGSYNNMRVNLYGVDVTEWRQKYLRFGEEGADTFGDGTSRAGHQFNAGKLWR